MARRPSLSVGADHTRRGEQAHAAEAGPTCGGDTGARARSVGTGAPGPHARTGRFPSTRTRGGCWTRASDAVTGDDETGAHVQPGADGGALASGGCGRRRTFIGDRRRGIIACRGRVARQQEQQGRRWRSHQAILRSGVMIGPSSQTSPSLKVSLTSPASFTSPRAPTSIQY